MGWPTPYAKAAVALASQAGAGQLAQLAQDVAQIGQLLQTSADVRGALLHPRWRTKRVALVNALAAKMRLSELGTALWRLLAQHSRLAAFAQLQAAVEQHIDGALGQVRAQVRTATATDAPAQAALHAALQGLVPDKSLVLAWLVDSSLLAGFRVRIGDLLIDTSLQTGLARLSQHLSD